APAVLRLPTLRIGGARRAHRGVLERAFGLGALLPLLRGGAGFLRPRPSGSRARRPARARGRARLSWTPAGVPRPRGAPRAGRLGAPRAPSHRRVARDAPGGL